MSFNFRTLPPFIFCLKLLFFKSSFFCVLLLKHSNVCKILNLTMALKLVAEEPDRYLERLWGKYLFFASQPSCYFSLNLTSLTATEGQL